jgi:hypothetical protein
MTLSISSSFPSPGTTPNGNPWIEVGTRTSLTLNGGSSTATTTWTTSISSIAYVPATTAGVVATIEGTGFGQITVTASQGSESSPGYSFYVGSVLIAGADGNYWQLFSDGSAQSIKSTDLNSTVPTLVTSNAIISDLTAQSTADAVTCYVLNLKSFAL